VQHQFFFFYIKSIKYYTKKKKKTNVAINIKIALSKTNFNKMKKDGEIMANEKKR